MSITIRSLNGYFQNEQIFMFMYKNTTKIYDSLGKAKYRAYYDLCK